MIVISPLIISLPFPMHQIPTTHTQKRADHGCLLQNQFNKLLYVIMHFCTLIALKIRD